MKITGNNIADDEDNDWIGFGSSNEQLFLPKV